MSKLDQHAWNDETCVLRAAFNALEKKHTERISVLTSYGAIPEDIQETIAFEEEAIRNVREKLLNYLKEE